MPVRIKLTDAQHRGLVDSLASSTGRPMKSGKPRRPVPLVAPGWAVEFTVPCVTKSMMNSGGSGAHWSSRYRLFKEQEKAVAVTMHLSLVTVATSQGVPLLLTFTRLGGQSMDSDNLAGSMKAVRDCLCRRLGRDDGDRAITFSYGQEVGNGPQGVRIRIESKGS